MKGRGRGSWDVGGGGMFTEHTFDFFHFPHLQQLPLRCRGKRACTPIPSSSANRSRLPYHTKGMHLVTREVVRECEEGLKDVKIGTFTLNCLHTSAGLTVGRQQY